MNKNRQFEGIIRGVSSKGYGVITHPTGVVYFIPGAIVDDYVLAQIVETKGRYGMAELIEVLKPSPFRVSAQCKYLGFDQSKCGGCPWQIIDYQKQCELKKEKVIYALKKRITGFQENIVKDVIKSSKIFNYRNRAQFKTDGTSLGFVSANSNNIIDIKECLLLNQECNTLLKTLREKLPNTDWIPTRDHIWNFIDLHDQMSFEEVKVNKKQEFRQANDDQNSYMKEWLKKHASNWKDKNVLELFCGSGNFTKIVADHVSSVVAIDSSGIALDKLKKEHSTKICVLDLNLFLPHSWRLLKKEVAKKCEVLVLDPPRDGVKNIKKMFDYFLDFKEVCYISCDVETFARDLMVFINKGFTLKEVIPVDQFPHTPHIELLAYLKCKDNV